MANIRITWPLQLLRLLLLSQGAHRASLSAHFPAGGDKLVPYIIRSKNLHGHFFNRVHGQHLALSDPGHRDTGRRREGGQTPVQSVWRHDKFFCPKVGSCVRDEDMCTTKDIIWSEVSVWMNGVGLMCIRYFSVMYEYSQVRIPIDFIWQSLLTRNHTGVPRWIKIFKFQWKRW